MKIYIVRHGETALNAKGVMQGRLNEPLNRAGRDLAVMTGKAMKGIHFDCCISSPLERAKETAQIILRESGNEIPFDIDERIIEIDFGDMEGKTIAEMGDEGHKFFMDPFYFAGFPNGETIKDVCSRTQDFLKELISKDDGKTYLISTHGCALRGMVNYLSEEPANYWLGHAPYNCSFTILEAECGKAKITDIDKVFYDPNLIVDHFKMNQMYHYRFDSYYTPARSKRQTYDLVIPKSASGSTGLVLCIHGGGWVEGNKDEYTGSLMRLSEEKGCAAACMNYRYVSETVGFDDILDDVSSALAAIKKAGAAYGVAFNRVLLTGISAGGHISLLYAYTRNAAAPIKPVCVVELCGPTNFEDGFYYSDENSVNRAVGPAYFRNIISNGVKHAVDPDDLGSAASALRRYSPVNYVKADTVPTVFGHGAQDTIVPYRNALDLEAALTANGVEHSFVSFPDSGHGCENKESMKKLMRLFFGCVDRYLK